MIELSDVVLQIDFSATGTDEVIQNVKTIITTPAGTVPFDRDFGIDWSLLDLPIGESMAKLTVEYIEKIKKYEPRASVNSISFTANDSGQLIPKVVINIVNA